jgi:hypothetical protein
MKITHEKKIKPGAKNTYHPLIKDYSKNEEFEGTEEECLNVFKSYIQAVREIIMPDTNILINFIKYDKIQFETTNLIHTYAIER